MAALNALRDQVSHIEAALEQSHVSLNVRNTGTQHAVHELSCTIEGLSQGVQRLFMHEEGLQVMVTEHSKAITDIQQQSYDIFTRVLEVQHNNARALEQIRKRNRFEYAISSSDLPLKSYSRHSHFTPEP